MKLPTKSIRTKSDAVKLFLFLCVVGLFCLTAVILQRDWFRTHLPSDRIGIWHEIGYGQYFTETSAFDQTAFWLFIGTPPLAAVITSFYMRYHKVKIT